MKKLGILLAGLALASASGLALAQADGQAPPPEISFAAQSHSVPFDLFRGNRIVVPAKLNGHAVEVVLDTGASVTTLDRAYARSIGLPEGLKVTARGAGGTVDAEVVSGVSLEIGGMRFDKMTVAVMDLSLVSRGIGRPLNVVVGREFFNSAVVSIDWSASRLNVSSHQAFRPAPAHRARREGPCDSSVPSPSSSCSS